MDRWTDDEKPWYDVYSYPSVCVFIVEHNEMLESAKRIIKIIKVVRVTRALHFQVYEACEIL